HIQGLPNLPFVLVASGNGNLQVGAANHFGCSYDLPLTPPYGVCLSGIANPAFSTDVTGNYYFSVVCPPPGNPPSGIPLNFHAAYQAAVFDYFNPFGWTLTAATRVT